ncbi:MAG: hypothetical protein PVG78_12305, partial [Desulfobacterales bacterium]
GRFLLQALMLRFLFRNVILASGINGRRKDMRQKFVISVDDFGKKLLIKEYADINRNRKYETAEMVAKRKYSLLYKETYESDLILDSIAKGINDLVSTIRTRNMFPTRPFAVKIAESVVTLYESSETDSVELFLDDTDSEVA